MKREMIYLSLLLFSTIQIKAQGQKSVDTTFQRKMVIERTYVPVLKEAVRMDVLPKIDEVKVTKTAIKYGYSPFSKQFPLQWKTVLPEKKMSNMTFQNQRGFAEVAFGLPTNSYGKAGIKWIDEENEKLTLSFDHRITNDYRTTAQTGKEKRFFTTDNFLSGLYFRKYESMALNAKAYYSHSAFNMPDSIMENKLTFLPYAPVKASGKSQIFNCFGLAGAIESISEASLGYVAGIDYNYVDKKYANSVYIKGDREHQIILSGNLYNKLSEESVLGLKASVQNYIYESDKRKTDSVNQAENYGILEFSPYYSSKTENMEYKVGVRSEFRFSGNARSCFSPSASVRWSINPRFSVNGQLGGGLEVFTLQKADATARYLNPALRLKDTFTPVDLRLGIQTTAIPHLGLELFSTYKNGEAYYFSSLYTASWRQVLMPLLTDTKQLSIGLEGKWSYGQTAEIDLRLAYNSYDVNLKESPTPVENAKAWGKPSFELNLNSSVSITPETSIRLDYRLETGRFGIDPLQTAITSVKMKPVHQMDLSSRYLFSNNLSAFAKLNNILFQKYDIWYGIPAQNFNFMVGIGYTF